MRDYMMHVCVHCCGTDCFGFPRERHAASSIPQATALACASLRHHTLVGTEPVLCVGAETLRVLPTGPLSFFVWSNPSLTARTPLRHCLSSFEPYFPSSHAVAAYALVVSLPLVQGSYFLLENRPRVPYVLRFVGHCCCHDTHPVTFLPLSCTQTRHFLTRNTNAERLGGRHEP